VRLNEPNQNSRVMIGQLWLSRDFVIWQSF